MKTIIASTVEQIASLKPLAEQWKGMCGCVQFGLDVDVTEFLKGLMKLVIDENADLLLLENDGKVIGLMGLTTFKSPFGKELVANEHYMFIKQGSNATGSKRLIDAAEQWAKEKGCSHLIMNASNAASDMHDKVCKFYERLGLMKFETSFIKEIS